VGAMPPIFPITAPALSIQVVCATFSRTDAPSVWNALVRFE